MLNAQDLVAAMRTATVIGINFVRSPTATVGMETVWSAPKCAIEYKMRYVAATGEHTQTAAS